jgi:hypothetical protein
MIEQLIHNNYRLLVNLTLCTVQQFGLGWGVPEQDVEKVIKKFLLN